MSYNIFKTNIEEKINKIQDRTNALIVVKGIPLETVGLTKQDVDICNMIANKLDYFLSTIANNRNIITYEEFIALYSFIIASFKKVYILTNNIYMDNLPLTINLPDNIETCLISHFNDTEEEENQEKYYIGDISDYIQIYAGLKREKGITFGVYNDEHIWLTPDDKLEIINIFDYKDFEINEGNYQDIDILDIVDEIDYIDLVKRVFVKPERIFIRVINYQQNLNRLLDRLRLLAYYWHDWTEFFICNIASEEKEFESKQQYKDLLNKYWKESQFRNIKVYDMEKLLKNEKSVITVSQERIIDNIVTEVEKCNMGDTNYRDIFVTAPTGAGKSAMFQIPAIYLAEKYNFLTLVISPLIGLMNDQVKNLELMDYPYAKTINSDISPIVKEDIINKVAAGEYHILYLSPETLLSRGDVEQLIGDREIGMIVIDEAHIVTTWGKQFRPDYWYLGDHIQKLRKRQMDKYRKAFVVASFTATAIYGGVENMYKETINSLHMLQPITYLGYVKREDITIRITQKEVKPGRSEYEYDKFEILLKEGIERAIITNKKTLIYFPTVALIERFYEYCVAKRMHAKVTKYHGSLYKDQKQENYEAFRDKEKLIMLATKAFGMGININDIELIIHFAPTGNVCDYVQEIGRAARKLELIGEAYYNHDSKDFKHINRLHGLSTIQKYQLLEVISKVEELYRIHLQSPDGTGYTKKRNAMLIDAENFSYIFGRENAEEGENINKVKTALLIIQKDFENRIGFSPIFVRPIPLFSIGFFKIKPLIQKNLLAKYSGCLEEIDSNQHICRVNLNQIWKKSYPNVSFPQFKYLIYSKSDELEFNSLYDLTSALSVDIKLTEDYEVKFSAIWECIKSIINESILTSKFYSLFDIVEKLKQQAGISKYKAESICEVLIASMDIYRKNYTRSASPIVRERPDQSGDIKYQFQVAVNSYIAWAESGKNFIFNKMENNKLYLINDHGNDIRQYSIILGILEAFNVLSFQMLGGANSQLYIYVNQIQSLRNIINNPYKYSNKLLESVGERHTISVEMLSFLYSNSFKNEQIWNYLEDYFLGIIPEEVIESCRKKKPDMII